MGCAPPDIEVGFFTAVFEGEFCEERVCVDLSYRVRSLWSFGEGVS
jgi:hypothetical protein